MIGVWYERKMLVYVIVSM